MLTKDLTDQALRLWDDTNHRLGPLVEISAKIRGLDQYANALHTLQHYDLAKVIDLELSEHLDLYSEDDFLRANIRQQIADRWGYEEEETEAGDEGVEAVGEEAEADSEEDVPLPRFLKEEPLQSRLRSQTFSGIESAGQNLDQSPKAIIQREHEPGCNLRRSKTLDYSRRDSVVVEDLCSAQELRKFQATVSIHEIPAPLLDHEPPVSGALLLENSQASKYILPYTQSVR